MKLKTMIQGLGSSVSLLALFATGVAQAAPHGMYFTRDLRALFAQIQDDDKIEPRPKKHPTDSTTTLLYYGGPVISNAKVGVVFWGPNVAATTQKQMPEFYKAIVNSTQLDWANKYNTHVKAVDGRQGTNQNIGRGTYIGQFLISPEHSGKAIDDKDIQDELERQIDAGKLPKPDANTLYMIHFPPGVQISIEGSQSCSSFCAYHEGFTSQKYGPIFYGVMPDQGGMCALGCGMSGSAFDSLTAVSSHELMEAVTDPFPTPGDKPAYPQAWNTSDGQEIADLCATDVTTLSSSTKTAYKISQEFDNATHSCANIKHNY